MGYNLTTKGHCLPSTGHSPPPTDCGIPPPDHGLLVPPPSADKSKMIPLRTQSTHGKDKEMDGGNVGGHLMALADDRSEDETSTPTEKNAGGIPQALTERGAGTYPPAPTETEAGTTLPPPTEKEAETTSPAPTGTEAGTTPEMPTLLKQKGTLKSDMPVTPRSESRSSDEDDGTVHEEYISCFLE